MRRFILLAATAALITASFDGCSRRPRPLRPHKEPHALALGSIGRPLAQSTPTRAPTRPGADRPLTFRAEQR